MPFPDQVPRPFTWDAARAINPGQYGCYGLFNSTSWVYVGKGDIRSRLLAHLRGDNPLIALFPPTHWVDVVTPFFDWLEKELILEYQPIANRRVG